MALMLHIAWFAEHLACCTSWLMSTKESQEEAVKQWGLFLDVLVYVCICVCMRAHVQNFKIQNIHQAISHLQCETRAMLCDFENHVARKFCLHVATQAG